MPIGGVALAIFSDWIVELERDHLWGKDDPLFPATQMGLGDDGGFVPVGLLRSSWSTTQPVNVVFRRAFEGAGLPYFNPHSFRDMLVRHAMTLGLSPEAMKAWSQNLGHADVMTTFTSYGSVPVHRQGELIRAANDRRSAMSENDRAAMLEALAAELRAGSAAGSL